MEKLSTIENIEIPKQEPQKKTKKIKFGMLGIGVELAENRGNARDMKEYEDDFKIPTIEWMEGEIAMAWRENEPILIEGGTGIGKTRTVERMCAQLGYELYKLPCSSSTTEREMMGRYVSNPNRKSETDPEVIFALGVIAEALKEEQGKIKVIYLDEINTIEGAVGARLHDILDEVKKEKVKGQVKLVEDAGEVLEFDPKKVKIVATMNSADSKNTHAQKLSEALLRRFTYKRTVDELPDVEFLSIASQKFLSNETLKDLPGISDDGELIKSYSECHKALQGLKRNARIGVGASQDFKFEDIDYLKRVIKKVSVFWEDGIFTDLPEAFREAVRIIYTGMIVDPTEKKMMEEQIAKLDFKPAEDPNRQGLADRKAKKKAEEARKKTEAEDKVKKEGEVVGKSESEKTLEKADAEIVGLKKFLRTKKREASGGSEFETVISAEYKTKDEKGKEKVENIEIDFEKKLEYSMLFYKENGIKVPVNFAEIMIDIWERNMDEMQKSIEKGGFDEAILVPGGLSISDVHTKMSTGYAETYKGSYFTDGGSFEGVTEKTTGPRIILIHKNNAQNLRDRPELKKTLGMKAGDLIKSGEKLSLIDYLIFQKQYLESTKKHLDEDGWTWLSGSTVKNPAGGVRVVLASWLGVGLYVDADDPGDPNPPFGCRLSRCFE